MAHPLIGKGKDGRNYPVEIQGWKGDQLKEGKNAICIAKKKILRGKKTDKKKPWEESPARGGDQDKC